MQLIATVTMIIDMHRTMLDKYLSSKSEPLDITNVLFQQDGVTVHAARETTAM